MVIELKMARGWRIWIDGKSPVGEWDIDKAAENEAGVRGYSLRQHGKPLVVVNSTISYVRFNVDEDDWSKRKPDAALVRVDGKRLRARITKVEWGSADTGPVTVELFNGEKLELDEITVYVRLEV